MTRAAVVSSWVGQGAGLDARRPKVSDDYQLRRWADVTGQPAEWIPKGALPYTVEIHATDTVLDQIEADAGYALLWRGTPPDVLNAATIQAQLSNVLDANVAEWCVKDAATFEDVQAKLSEAQHRPPWEAGESVAVNDIRAYQTNLYKCVQAHTTQADWTPPATPALWVKFYEPEAGPQPWIQPTGAHDAYQTGDRVTHPDRENTMGTGAGTIWVWESRIDANTTEPGQDGQFHRWWEPIEQA